LRKDSVCRFYSGSLCPVCAVSYASSNEELYDDYQAEKNDIFLSCLFICEAKYRRMGLGSKLLKDIVSDLKIRGFNRIETFARRGSANNPSGPLEFYLKHGFEIKKELDRNFILVTLNLKD